VYVVSRGPSHSLTLDIFVARTVKAYDVARALLGGMEELAVVAHAACQESGSVTLCNLELSMSGFARFSVTFRS
jgi:hypothetical protein